MLIVKNLVVSFGPIKAVRGISFEVPTGKIVTLIGANGAGKSTTLRAISGLSKAASGSINWEGREITSTRPDQIVKLGIGQSPEGRRIFANMSVKENLELGSFVRHGHKQIKTDYDLCLSLFPRLSERLSQNAGTLSGGEQQMLSIARALMSNPRLLLLDEPSLGLAPFLVRDIFQIIGTINKEGKSVLLVEQNAHLALGVADEGYVIESGEIILHDKAKALLNNPAVKQAYLGE